MWEIFSSYNSKKHWEDFPYEPENAFKSEPPQSAESDFQQNQPDPAVASV